MHFHVEPLEIRMKALTNTSHYESPQMQSLSMKGDLRLMGSPRKRLTEGCETEVRSQVPPALTHKVMSLFKPVEETRICFPLMLAFYKLVKFKWDIFPLKVMFYQLFLLKS